MFEMNAKKDIHMARKIVSHVNRYKYKIRNYGQIPFKGTENIYDLYNQLDTDFANSLIVAGSFDQSLEAIRHDAKTIKTFDINQLSEYGIILKFCAILALEYEEFLEFYGFVPGEVMSKKAYIKIREAMNVEAQEVWDKIFATYSNEVIFNNLFDRANHGSALSNRREQISIYTKEGYEEIRKKIWDVFFSFTHCNLLDIGKTSLSEEQYNFIYLSNIRFYLKGMSNAQYVQFLHNSILPLLKDNGVVVVDYLYRQYIPAFANSLQDVAYGLYTDLERSAFVHDLKQIPGVEVEEHFIATSGYGHYHGPVDVALVLRKK